MRKIKIYQKMTIFMIFFCMIDQGTAAQVFTKITTGPLVTEANNGNAAAWGDYDGDGDLDLFIAPKFSSATNINSYSSLYQNNCNGEFTKVSRIPNGVLQTTESFADCFWVDYDADGDLDLYVGIDELFENNGDGSFTQVEKAITNLPDYTTATTGGVTNVGKGSACWLDYDNDGKLDFYSGRKEIYHNNGNGDYDVLNVSPFNDITAFMRGDAITTADINNDGLMDIFICSPRTNFTSVVENVLYQNTGNGTFIENDMTGLTDIAGSSYGCAWGDIDNDLDLDVWVGRNFYQGDLLYINDGTGMFTLNTTDPIATNVNANQSGASWADYDNDGDLDLVVPTFTQNYIYNNDGSGNFTEITNEIISNDFSAESYSASWADYDNDGDLDLFVLTAYGDPNDYFYVNNIYQNNTTNANWIKVDLKGVQSNIDAVGARVYVKATINGVSKWQMREININGSNGGESGAVSGQVIHFGLGDATNIEILKVVWPASGVTQEFYNVSTNRFLEIVENSNALTEKSRCTPDLPSEESGFVTGKLYIDENQNCVYDQGIDSPIANKAMRAEPGVYYAFTNNQGDYTFQLPAGDYVVKENSSDVGYETSACQSEREFPVTVTVGNTKAGNDLPFDKSLLPCNGSIDLAINGVGTDPNDCPTGLTNIVPCPGHTFDYCVTVTNNSNATIGLPTNPNSVLAIRILDGSFFPSADITIQSASGACGTGTVPGSNLWWMDIPVPNGIPPGGSCEICFTLEFGPNANGQFQIIYDYNNSPWTLDESNAVINGDFSAGNSGFTFDPSYTYSNLNVPGSVFVTDVGFTGIEYDGTNMPGDNFLRVDGATVSSNFWCEDITVLPNTTYTFGAAINNLINDQFSNFSDPEIEVTVNGVSLGTSAGIPEDPDGWQTLSGYQDWCSDDNTTVTLCMSLANGSSMRGNDFAVDNIYFSQSGSNAYREQSAVGECSCDPNDKVVTPQGCGENGNVKNDQLLSYKIHFENTGSGPAHNILLSDKLDEDLDLSTLEILASSHAITNYQIQPDNRLIIRFDGIMLPSNLVDPIGANGYVIFTIKPKVALPDGTEILNQCGIYFDKNEVVLTEVTKNTLYEKPSPEADFTYKHSCSQTGYAYDFTYVGGTPDNATYLWEFEGATPSTSTAQNPANVIFSNSSELKSVRLTVTRNGCSETSTEEVQPENGLSANGKKVLVCHNGNTIEIAPNALAAHLAHGDCIGSCAGSATGKYLKAENSHNTSLVKNAQPFSVLLFPNPSNETCKMTIQGLRNDEKVQVEIWSYSGQIQKSFETQEQAFIVPTKDLSNGLYFVKISTNSNTVLNKLLIQH